MLQKLCDRDGYAIVEDVLAPDAIERYISLLEHHARIDEGRGGLRSLLDIAEIRQLANSPAVMNLVHQVLSDKAFPVRGILFDKQEGANWKVPWHQDVTIAVTEKTETPGYGPWSVKGDVQHVQPPTSILQRMVSVRLHLDDCPASNGALRVIAGSHHLGRVDQTHIAKHVRADREHVCEVRRGGALLMSPLTIHASSASVQLRHRRVIHLDYTDSKLNGSLEWFYS